MYTRPHVRCAPLVAAHARDRPAAAALLPGAYDELRQLVADRMAAEAIGGLRQHPQATARILDADGSTCYCLGVALDMPWGPPMSPDPFLDPDRTGPLAPAPAAGPPETVDVTADHTPDAAPTPPPGAPTIPGYEIHDLIARGGMGAVFAGRDITLDREVAVKTLLPGANPDRFVTEAKITAQLPHPGIPPVYALGTLSDGGLFLAMKLIRGDTLARLLKDRSSPADNLPRFVQVFEQIAQAVGFAHSRGVLHRDLKPLNVMVGEFGEVQVMDWGLAKDTASRDREGAEAAPEADVPHTRAGSVMGTPGYMAPEQARGEVVDARADVFALGSTLAAILTGQPAFVGTTARETIGKAAKADTADVLARLDACGADAELTSLARRCLAARAGDRPADARQVADEVGAYRAGVEARLRQAETDRARAETRAAEQAKRRRVVQRAGGVIAAVLLIGLGVSLWQMNRAVDAEGQAKTNEQTAINERDAKDVALTEKSAALIAKTKALNEKDVALTEKSAALGQTRIALRSLTDEIVEKQMARGATLTEENKAFLRAILTQYEVLAAITGDDAESRLIRTEGQARVGLMRYRLGELKEAEAAYRDALQLDKQLADDFPTNPEYRRRLAISHNNLGNLLHDTGRWKEAETAHTDALTLRKQLTADFPTRPEFRKDLAGSRINLGNLLRDTGHWEEAKAAYTEAVAILKQLTADFPTKPAFHDDLASSYGNLGNLLGDTGHWEEAKAAYSEALTLRKRLAAHIPTNPAFRHDLANCHYSLGVLLLNVGRWKEAEAAYTEALAILKQLAADFPTNPAFRHDLANSHYNLGVLLKTTGRLKEAEVAYTDALALSKRLAADFPTNPTFRRNLADSHNTLGFLLKTTGRLKEAEVAYTDALALSKQLVIDFPTNPDFRRTLAESHKDLGVLLSDTGRVKEAGAAYADALGILKRLASDFPTNPGFRYHLAESHSCQGKLLHNTGRLREAEAAYTDALAILKRLAADFPARPEFRGDLANGHISLGVLLSDTGRLKEAEAAYTNALAILKQLAADFPTNPDFRRDLAGIQGNLGLLLKATSRLKEAEAAYADANALWKQLAADFPARTAFRAAMANNHNNLGALLRDSGRWKEAEVAYADALAIQKRLTADFPTVTAYKIDLGGSCCNFGSLLRDTGRVGESLNWFAEAIAVLKTVLDGNVKDPTARLFLRNSLWSRALAYDRLGKPAEAVHDWDQALELSPPNDQRFIQAGRAISRMRAGQVTEAVSEVDELTKLRDWNANRWYSFACIYAVAARQGADKKAEYADRAMEMLQKAVKAGYKDAAHIKKDSDLDPLRDRADFTALLADLEKKFPPPLPVAPPPREKK